MHDKETRCKQQSTFISALRHPEPTRAGLAIDILTKRLYEPRAVEPLIELLNTAYDLDILAQAACGLGVLGDRQAIQSLADLLGNPNKPLVARREAAFALGKLGGDEAKGRWPGPYLTPLNPWRRPPGRPWPNLPGTDSHD